MTIKTVTFKFEGIDYWSRPVYKDISTNVRIGSVNVLFPNKQIAPNNTPQEINEYFRNNLDNLVIFGTSFDEDDPLGYTINKNVNIKIID